MILEREINLIKNENLRLAIEAFIEEWKDKIPQLPCTFSGRYHPPEQRGSGGLILHIQRMCRLATGIKTQLSLNDAEFDVLIAGIILHDMSNLIIYSQNKDGKWEGDEDMFNEWHEELSFLLFIPFMEITDISLTSPLALNLQALIHSHTGGWTPQNKQPTRKLEIILSMLDYIDSREYVHIDV